MKIINFPQSDVYPAEDYTGVDGFAGIGGDVPRQRSARIFPGIRREENFKKKRKIRAGAINGRLQKLYRISQVLHFPAVQTAKRTYNNNV